MAKREDLTLLITGIVLVLTTALVVFLEPRPDPAPPPMAATLLSDPFLQRPTADSVQVVWFTEFEGTDHRVEWGTPGRTLAQTRAPQQAPATTTRLSRLREDGRSRLDWPALAEADTPIDRPIWRHEATVSGLQAGQRYPYRVVSDTDDGASLVSNAFTLAPAPAPGQPLTLLLTSDHQAMPMTAANLQKVEETVGQVDGVLLAGDLVNIPDRASEWFDDRRGNGFFPCLQGRADYALEKDGAPTVRYRGGELIQHAPLFPAVGNHEVMGRFSLAAPLNDQFNDPVPRAAAVAAYTDQADLFNPTGDETLRRQWIIDNSFNRTTYEELFTLPTSTVANPERAETTSRYYALTLGDVRLVALDVTQIWRSPSLDPAVRGRYRERAADVDRPSRWGHGQHIFEPIHRGSLQYQWLERELASDGFRQARYRIVMFHHPAHTLGDNIVPPFTDPRPLYDRDPDGRLRAVRYDYPLAEDHIARDLVPLLEEAGVDLVLYGHSHLWNRFQAPSGTHYLETSNVGNTYGAYWREQSRPVPPVGPSPAATENLGPYSPQNYIAQGDPNGLEPIVPTLAPLLAEDGTPLPYIASNDLTVFSILETASGTVSSYYFDTRQPRSAVVKFDQFRLGAE